MTDNLDSSIQKAGSILENIKKILDPKVKVHYPNGKIVSIPERDFNNQVKAIPARAVEHPNAARNYDLIASDIEDILLNRDVKILDEYLFNVLSTALEMAQNGAYYANEEYNRRGE